MSQWITLYLGKLTNVKAFSRYHLKTTKCHRVPIPEEERPDPEAFTPVHPDCLSGPEVQRKLAALRQRAGAAAEAVRRLRQESPAKFCAAASAFFLALACVGSGVTVTSIAGVILDVHHPIAERAIAAIVILLLTLVNLVREGGRVRIANLS